MLAYPEVQDRAHAELDEVSPLSPLHSRDSQRDAALVAHGPVRCSARLECGRLARGRVNTKGHDLSSEHAHDQFREGRICHRRDAVQPGEVSGRELLGQGARRQGGGTHVVWVWAAHMLWEIRCGGHVGDRLVDAGLDNAIRAS